MTSKDKNKREQINIKEKIDSMKKSLNRLKRSDLVESF